MSLDKLTPVHIRVFVAVYTHQKARLAAKALHMTPVEVTRTLNDLREMCGDTLFVRRAGGLVPNSRAKELVPYFQKLDKATDMLAQKIRVFDPALSQAHFEILTYDEHRTAVYEALNWIVKNKAPGMRFNVGLLNYDCNQAIKSGLVDFAVVYEGFGDDTLVHEMFAAPDDLYLICRKDHPLATAPLTTKNISRYPSIDIDNYMDVDEPLLETVCREDGFEMPRFIHTDSLSSVCSLLTQSDAVTMACSEFTKHFVSTMPELTSRVLPGSIASRMRAICSVKRPIGNYLVYSKKRRSAEFLWVKDRLLERLSALWREAARENRSEEATRGAGQ